MLVLLLLLPLIPIVITAPAGATIDTVVDFDEYVQISGQFARTTYTPPVNEKEAEKWSMKVKAPDMAKRTCEEKLTLALLTVCAGSCNTGRQELVSKELCNNVEMKDAEIQGACCPEMLPKKTKKKKNSNNST
uniref:Secreted protein n=1 Tax=Caenorhabditis tropicalis TaxID=1561998 RepID=A0A1I7TVG1_9PELO